MDRIEAIRHLAAEAQRGELGFPTNLNATLKIGQALDDPDCHIDGLARLVQAEPLLAARAVAMANSVAYNRSGREVTSVQAALSLLGLRTLRALAAAESVRQFGRMILNPALRAKSAQLWEHTAHVAALARVIAGKIAHQDAETALFAGIVHEVGGFFLISRAHAYPGLLDGDPRAWMEHGEQAVTDAVLKELAVPATVVAAVEAPWQQRLGVPLASLGDCLLLADELAAVASPLRAAGAGALPEASRQALDQAVGAATLREVLAESESEVRALTALLL